MAITHFINEGIQALADHKHSKILGAVLSSGDSPTSADLLTLDEADDMIPTDMEFLTLLEDAVYDEVVSMYVEAGHGLFSDLVSFVESGTLLTGMSYAIPSGHWGTAPVTLVKKGLTVEAQTLPVWLQESGFPPSSVLYGQTEIVKFDLLEAWKTKGKHLSAEHKKKISDALKARALLKGKKTVPYSVAKKAIQAHHTAHPHHDKKAALAAKKAAMPGMAEMKAKYPKGSKIKTPEGEFTVVGHAKGYVEVTGHPKGKWKKHDLLDQWGNPGVGGVAHATPGLPSGHIGHGIDQLTAHTKPTHPIAGHHAGGGAGGASPAVPPKGMAALKQAYPVGSKVMTPHGEVTVTGHNSTHVVVSGGPQKMYPPGKLKPVTPKAPVAPVAPVAPKVLVPRPAKGEVNPMGQVQYSKKHPPVVGQEVYSIVNSKSGVVKSLSPTGASASIEHPDGSVSNTATGNLKASKNGNVLIDWTLDVGYQGPTGGHAVPTPAPTLAPTTPLDSSAHLEHVKALGGSTGAVLVKDPATGKQYVLKHGTTPEHLAAEYSANKIYEAVGVGVPKATLVDGGKTQLTEYHEGTLLRDLKGQALIDAHKKVGEHFVLDAVLANRDVIGPKNDNILVTPDGHPVRIDVGGSLDYSGLTGKKAFTHDVVELAGLRNPSLNPNAAKVYAHLTDADIRQQALDLHAKRDVILAATPEKYRDTVNARIDDVLKKTGGIPGHAGTPISTGLTTGVAPSQVPGAMETAHGTPTGHKDKNGTDLHIGDSVKWGGSEGKVVGKDPYGVQVAWSTGETTAPVGAVLTKTGGSTAGKPTLPDGTTLGVGDTLKHHMTGENLGKVHAVNPDGTFDLEVAGGHVVKGANASMMSNVAAIKATLATPAGPAHDPKGQGASANPVKALHSKKDILAAHPVGSKIHLKDGTVLTVTNATTGYVYADGGPGKMFKVEKLAAQGATYGEGSPHASHIPATPPAGTGHNIKDTTSPSKWTGKKPVEGFTGYGTPVYAAAQTTAGVITGLTGKHTSIEPYGPGYLVTNQFALPPQNGKIKEVHNALLGQGFEYVGKNTEDKFVYGHLDKGSVILGKTGKAEVNPSKIPATTGLSGQYLVASDGGILKTKDGVEVKIGDVVYPSYGYPMKVVGQNPLNGNVLTSIDTVSAKKPPVYEHGPALMKQVTATPKDGTVAVTPTSSSPAPVYHPPKDIPVANKAPGDPPVGIPGAHVGSTTAASPVSKPADPIADAHKAVPPAPANTNAGSSPKYDQSHPPKVGQAVYHQGKGNAVVTSVSTHNVGLKYADGTPGGVALPAVANSSHPVVLKPYDPVKAAVSSTGVVSSGNGNSSKNPFTPLAGWPTGWIKGETTKNNPQWVGEQTAIIKSLTSAEKDSVTKYTGNTTYKSINNHLRHGDSITPANQKHIENIDKAMVKSAADHDFMVYRGVGNDSKTGLAFHMEVGKVFQDPGYMSTSLVKGSEFGGSTMMEILVPKGTPGLYARAASAYPTEDEYLLGRGTKFMVHEIQFVGGVRHVRLEAIPPTAPGAEKFLKDQAYSLAEATFLSITEFAEQYATTEAALTLAIVETMTAPIGLMAGLDGMSDVVTWNKLEAHSAGDAEATDNTAGATSFKQMKAFAKPVPVSEVGKAWDELFGKGWVGVAHD